MSYTEWGDGPALARWIDDLRGEQSVREWAREYRLQNTWVSEWSGGRKPTIEKMRELADRLAKPLADVLVAAKWATPDDVGGVLIAPPCTVERALETDRMLDDESRGHLLHAYRLLTRNRDVVKVRRKT